MTSHQHMEKITFLLHCCILHCSAALFCGIICGNTRRFVVCRCVVPVVVFNVVFLCPRTNRLYTVYIKVELAQQQSFSIKVSDDDQFGCIFFTTIVQLQSRVRETQLCVRRLDRKSRPRKSISKVSLHSRIRIEPMPMRGVQKHDGVYTLTLFDSVCSTHGAMLVLMFIPMWPTLVYGNQFKASPRQTSLKMFQNKCFVNKSLISVIVFQVILLAIINHENPLKI